MTCGTRLFVGLVLGLTSPLLLRHDSEGFAGKLAVPPPSLVFVASPPTARVGDSVTITLTTRPGGDATPLDLYVAIGLPSGQFLFRTEDPFAPFSEQPAVFRRNLVPSQQTLPIFSDLLPPGVALGEYSLLAAYVRLGQAPLLTNLVGDLARGTLVVSTTAPTSTPIPTPTPSPTPNPSPRPTPIPTPVPTPTPVPVPLDISGAWSLSGQVTQSGCADLGNNGRITEGGPIIFTQVGSSVSGSGTVTLEGLNQTATFTLTGTIVGGQFSGSFQSVNTTFGLVSAGTFNGSASGRLLSATMSGRTTSGERCLLTGSFMATR